MSHPFVLSWRLILVLFALGCTLSRATQSPGKISADRAPLTAKEIADGYRGNVVIVKPAEGMALDRLEQSELAEGYKLLRSFPFLSGMRVLEIPSGMSVKEANHHLESTGRYHFASPVKLHRFHSAPNDPMFSQQWSLQNTGATGGVVGADIKAVSAWSILHDAPSVIVAVIDSGLRLTHPDIALNLWTNTGETANNSRDDDLDGYIDDVHGINATTPTHVGEGDPFDDGGHGTHIAGIIGAYGNNGVGVSGVAWRVQIMPLKAGGADRLIDSVAAIECIQYAIKHGASIINLSYGSSDYISSEYTALKAARDAGIIVVASAGNDSADLDAIPDYPACYPLDNIVAVGSTDDFDYPSSFSNFGAGICDLSAPGENILSLGFTADTGANVYVTKSGTSMSAPHVSGALALLKAKFPTESYRQLINRLLRNVDTSTLLEGQSETAGRLNLFKALSSTDSRPFNDDFLSSAHLKSSNASVRTSNVGATIEPAEPSHAGVPSTSSLWWEWTAKANQRVSLDTSGSDFHPVIGVYTGAALNALVPVASNDGSAAGSAGSLLSFSAIEGTSYHIALASKAGVSGFIKFSLTGVPDNDKFASATVITGLSPKAPGTTANASYETGEQLISGTLGMHSVWYKWTAPKTLRYQASVYSSAFDPMMAVYTGTSLGTLVSVASNNDSTTDASNTSSLCSFTAAEGTTYYICVDSYDGVKSGSFTLIFVDSSWQYVTSYYIGNSPAVAADGTIYVSGADYYVDAINPDGTRKWRYKTAYNQDSTSVSVADDGTVIVPSPDGYLYALKADGSLRWKYNTGTSLANSPAVSSDGAVIIKAADGSVLSIDLALGTRKWSYATGATDTYAGPAIGSDGTVYVGGGDKAFHAISPGGTRAWRFLADDEIYTSAAIDSAGNLYFGTLSGTFYSLTSAGTLRWSRSFPPTITSSPAIDKTGTVYFAGYDHKLHALKCSDGSDRWSFALGDEVRASSPAIDDNGTVYVGCYDGKLYAVNADGSLSRTYSTGYTIRSSPVIFKNRLYVGSYDCKLYAFDIASTVSAGDWPMRNCNAARLGRAFKFASAQITAQPQGQQALTGGSVSLSVSASGTDLAYQWYKDGQAIAGATASSYTKANAGAADAGSYSVVVSNSASTKTSDAALVTVVTLRKGRLYGLSTRGPAGSGSATMIVGVVMSAGSDGKKKNLIVRGLGPDLANRDITNFLPNPQIELYSGANRVAINKDWGGTSALRQAFQSVSLPDLPTASKDAALLASLDPSGYTFLISDETGGSGIVLGELYDTDTTPVSDAARATQGRLFGISTRALISGGDNVLIAGFSFDGEAPMKLLIQGVGPSLVPQGISNPLNKPHLDIYQGTKIIASNEKWGGASTLSEAAAKSYATALISPSSNDSAILITLQPGTYTAILQSADSSSGVGLVEVYEVP